MSPFTRFFGGAMLASSVAFPYLASTGGWGVGSERNASVISQMRAKKCPAHLRRIDGTCRRSHRGYYGRSYFGGGPSRGK